MSERRTSRKPLKVSEPEMRPEYDFSHAVRGKYYKRYLEGTNVVVLEPDIAKRFKSSAAVNKVLREYLRGKEQAAPTTAQSPARKRSTG